MISLGMPNKVIAAKLFITEKTVKTHANHVFRKLGVANRLQATLVFQSYHRARRAGSGSRGARKRSDGKK
jgi:DNA-binding NarL/FixJ family response regulator